MPVDCTALNQTLTQISALQAEIESLWSQTEQTGTVPKGLIQKLQQLTKLQDQLLTDNLENFVEMYPNFKEKLKPIAKYGNEIPGFGKDNDILSTLQLDPETVLVTGDDGETRLLTKQANGEWQYGSKIPGFNRSIYSTLQLDPETILVTGDMGKTCLLKVTKSAPDLSTLKAYLKDKVE